MEKIKIYYSIGNGGDGSAYLKWFLTGEEASRHQEGFDSESYVDEDNEDDDVYEGDNQFAEDCSGSVETFVGSDIHKEARKNSILIPLAQQKSKAAGNKNWQWDYGKYLNDSAGS